MARVLMVSLSLPPFRESQTIRSAYLIEAAARYGVQFGLLTASVPDSYADPSLYRLIPPEVPCWRTSFPHYSRVRDRLRRLRWGRLWDYLYANIAYRLFIPDVYAGWQNHAYQLATQVIPSFRPDVLMSASGSCTSHLACARLSSDFGIQWIADLGDPWSWVDWQHWDTWYKAIRNSLLERRTLRKADSIIVTTPQTEALYRAMGYNQVVVIPYGYRAEEFDTHPLTEADLPITFVYVGSASRRARNLIPLITALASSEVPFEFRLQIVGETSVHFYKTALRLGIKWVDFTGYVPYDQSIQFIRKASILILIGNRSPYQVPGKTFAYLASCRPILYLSQIGPENDPALSILQHFAGVRVIPNDVSKLQSFFRNLTLDNFHEWKLQARTHLSEKLMLDYKTDNLAKIFFELVNNKIRSKILC
ncbi:MAG: hypothetical protein C4337_02060 [Armatimonadota bacterium]